MPKLTEDGMRRAVRRHAPLVSLYFIVRHACRRLAKTAMKRRDDGVDATDTSSQR